MCYFFMKFKVIKLIFPQKMMKIDLTRNIFLNKNLSINVF